MLRAKVKNFVKDEAEKLLQNFADACFGCFTQDDEHIRRKYYRLVKTKKTFEELLDKGAIELTGELKSIRICMVEKEEIDQCREKGIEAEFLELLNNPEDFTRRQEAFYLWHGITPTATYYFLIK